VALSDKIKEQKMVQLKESGLYKVERIKLLDITDVLSD